VKFEQEARRSGDTAGDGTAKSGALRPSTSRASSTNRTKRCAATRADTLNLVAHENDRVRRASADLASQPPAVTLRALVLASELVHDTPATMRDPARSSFAHDGKDGTPFPVDKIT
jgi:hypothetical protein